MITDDPVDGPEPILALVKPSRDVDVLAVLDFEIPRNCSRPETGTQPRPLLTKH